MTKKKIAAPEVETAPLEAYPPQAVLLAGEDYVIRACDGDHEYLWTAQKKRTKYHVIEVYPGLAVSESPVRDAYEQADLDLGDYPSISDALEYLTQALFEDFEFEDAERQLPANAEQLRVTATLIEPRLRALRSGTSH